MSRFYQIIVGAETAAPAGAISSGPSTNNGGGPIASGASNLAGATWTNLVNGQADLGAQMIELDVHAFEFDAPTSQSYVRIWGPTKQQISQASLFNGAPIQVFGGMQKGLPLATAAANGQAGLLISGQIFQAFGNWQGLTQTLDFVITSDGGATQSKPANLSFLWLKGQPLSLVIQQTLKIAYPGYQVNINIDPNLILTQTVAGTYDTIQRFATFVKGVSQNILGPSYAGVSITLADGEFNVYDGSGDTFVQAPKQILIQDLIGQPTWLGPNQVSFSTVMRADLSGGDGITFPAFAGYEAVTTPQSGSNARAANTFSGTWQIQYIRHVGNSRAPDAQSWISTFQAISKQASPAAISVADSSA